MVPRRSCEVSGRSGIELAKLDPSELTTNCYCPSLGEAWRGRRCVDSSDTAVASAANIGYWHKALSHSSTSP